jgi:hypothetical protein
MKSALGGNRYAFISVHLVISSHLDPNTGHSLYVAAEGELARTNSGVTNDGQHGCFI